MFEWKSIKRQVKLANMQLFQSYIVGVQKAGTTSLYDWLAQHPDVLAPVEAKDFPTFSGDEEDFEKRLARMRRLYAQDPDEDQRIRLGAEANLVFSPHGIERLANHVPECRIIFLIRRPEDRCFSAWRYARERGLDERSFAKAIEAEISGDTFPADSYEGRQMNYLDHSRYADQLAKLKAHFPAENLLVLPFELMRDAPERIMVLICDFLGIKRHATVDFRAANVTSSASRSKVLNSVLHRKRNARIFAMVRCLLPSALRANIRERLIEWNRSVAVAEHPDPAPEIMRRLHAILADDVRLHEQIMADVSERVHASRFLSTHETPPHQ